MRSQRLRIAPETLAFRVPRFTAEEIRIRRTRLKIGVEALEGRQLRAGIPTDYVLQGSKWPSPAITFSVAPDGTDWNGVPSTLNAAMAGDGVNLAAGITRALNLWAAAGKLQFSPVADDGEPRGASGPSQGDSRFGDIRIGGYDFGNPSILGTTYYPTQGTTLAGDVTLNTGADWTHVDLASALAHEFGHSLGLAHASDPGEVMYPSYTGYVSALGDGDVAGIRALYGKPTPSYPVFNMPPNVNAGVNAVATVGVVFARAGSFADSDPDAWTATVDYGDGSGVRALPLNPDHTYMLSHTYAAAGKYTVAVTIDDGHGQGRGFFAVAVAAPPRQPAAPTPAPAVPSTPRTRAQQRALARKQAQAARRAAQQAASQAARVRVMARAVAARDAIRGRLVALRDAVAGRA